LIMTKNIYNNYRTINTKEPSQKQRSSETQVGGTSPWAKFVR
jgi:hypothetical protein